MGWDNPPLPWRELERRLSWANPAGKPTGGSGSETQPEPDAGAADPGPGAAAPPRHPHLIARDEPRRAGDGPAWAELHCHSSYSFLDGASSPEELVAEAVARGLEALAITDHDGMYGVPQFAQAAARLKRAGIRLGTVFGAELSMDLPGGQGGVPDPVGRHLLVLARDPEGYRRLCQVISAAQLRGGEKGRPVYDRDELAQAHDGHWVILTGCRKGAVPAALATAGPQAAARELRALAGAFGRQNVVVELTTHDQPTDDERNNALYELARQAETAVIATSNVHYASPPDARLAQALAAIRARRSLDEMDGWLAASGAAYLRSGAEMAHRLRRYPGVQQRTVELAAECTFDFHVIAPKLPDSPVPKGHTEATWLRQLVMDRAPERYGPPEAERLEGAYAQIASELKVIVDLGFPGYFLIVQDIVQFCERNGILCQGRGSAANSAVCYALGITSVDPVRHGLLFERFLSAGRDGPPDIDLDIEHQRREEVIQYVYDRYGRRNAAQVANVISYRPRMALRDAGRAFGYEPGQLDAWGKQVGPRPYGPGQPIPPDAGVPPAVTALAARMQRLPRHLGIHSGGMVICDRPAGEVCPVEWARMPGRTVLQWDKDDCAYAGLVKFDLLGLGMLTALRDCFELVEAHHGQRWSLDSIPQEDPGVYDMLCEADTVGVFQVESRAQMATLPRLRPREFYDLVVEVALIRPGPIQGGSVHPYMRRRHGDELADLPHESMRSALAKTLGVPLFQEQMMQLAIDCASFTPTEADQLRQAMSSKRAPERIEELRGRLLAGMAANGIPAGVAEDVYVKILAFSSYGFPESHAISFAYLVYASAWLKCYYPAAFTAALLRAQPMGFYAPASLISDVRRHGVQVRGVDVNASAVLATLENPTFTSHNGSPPRGTAGAEAAGGDAPRGDAVRPDAAGPDPAGGKPVAGRGAGHGGRVRLLRDQQARSAVGGRGGGHHPRRAATRNHPGPGRSAAAGHDGGRGDLRRPVGDRNVRHPPDRAHPARSGGAGRDRGRSPANGPAGRERDRGRAGNAPAAAGDRPRGGVPEPGGRDRDGEHHLSSSRLGAPPPPGDGRERAGCLRPGGAPGRGGQPARHPAAAAPRGRRRPQPRLPLADCGCGGRAEPAAPAAAAGPRRTNGDRAGQQFHGEPVGDISASGCTGRGGAGGQQTRRKVPLLPLESRGHDGPAG